ncbi:MAG TPA: radical SAM protein [Nitrospinota bacterium]|nr:radical SAM protein [Nitrospinota bacterium]|tara:strand:+ start:128901 stop:130388 length:1488 start_codon:yes stop_codon:yes gene_type:complete
MSIKVILCVPPQGYFAERWKENSMPALGILYMAGCLEREGIEVSILPSHVMRLEISDIVLHVEDHSPDIFGFTVTTENRLESFEAARQVKRARPQTMVVLGGPHCFTTAQDTLSHIPEIDAVVSGEGEETIVELAKALEAGGLDKDLAKVKGLIYRKNGRIISNPPRAKIPDLNSLPDPARHLEDMSLYNFNIEVPGKGLLPAGNVMTSRGCPFDCNFCATPGNWGRNVRGFSPERVINEIEVLIDQYGTKVIWFFDDTLNYNPKRLDKILDLMIERKLDVNWFCEIRVDIMERRLFDKMVDAGLFHIGFGIESANERICRDIIHKKASLQHAENVIDWCQDANIIANPFFIFSHPTETWSEALETLEYAESLKERALCGMAIMHLYPATELWNKAIEDGNIPSDFTWTSEDDQRILELPEAQGRVPLYLDKLSWFQISTIIFRFAQSALKVSLWSKLKKVFIHGRINSFRRFKQYFTMGMALLVLKARKFFGGV